MLNLIYISSSKRTISIDNATSPLINYRIESKKKKKETERRKVCSKNMVNKFFFSLLSLFLNFFGQILFSSAGESLEREKETEK